MLDTNILVSSLLVQVGHPAAIYRAWRQSRFILLTCEEQLDELRTTLRKPAVAERIRPQMISCWRYTKLPKPIIW